MMVKQIKFIHVLSVITLLFVAHQAWLLIPIILYYDPTQPLHGELPLNIIGIMGIMFLPVLWTLVLWMRRREKKKEEGGDKT